MTFSQTQRYLTPHPILPLNAPVIRYRRVVPGCNTDRKGQ